MLARRAWLLALAAAVLAGTALGRGSSPPPGATRSSASAASATGRSTIKWRASASRLPMSGGGLAGLQTTAAAPVSVPPAFTAGARVLPLLPLPEFARSAAAPGPLATAGAPLSMTATTTISTTTPPMPAVTVVATPGAGAPNPPAPDLIVLDGGAGPYRPALGVNFTYRLVLPVPDEVPAGAAPDGASLAVSAPGVSLVAAASVASSNALTGGAPSGTVAPPLLCTPQRAALLSAVDGLEPMPDWLYYEADAATITGVFLMLLWRILVYRLHPCRSQSTHATRLPRSQLNTHPTTPIRYRSNLL